MVPRFQQASDEAARVLSADLSSSAEKLSLELGLGRLGRGVTAARSVSFWSLSFFLKGSMRGIVTVTVTAS